MKMNIAVMSLFLSLSTYAQVDFNQLIQASSEPTQISTNSSAAVAQWQTNLQALNAKASQASAFFRGGSGVGGGNSHRILLDWCDEANDMLDETRLIAQEELGLYNDKMSALRIYFEGLKSALDAVQTGGNHITSSITYKAILRGLNLSSQLGIIELLYGGGHYSNKTLDDAIYFLDDYYQFVIKTAYQYDWNYYSQGRSIDTLEREFINFVTSQLNFWLDKFIKSQSNREGSFSTIGLESTLKGFAYLAEQTALDLETSYYNNVYRCQSRQLQRLAQRVSRSLNDSAHPGVQTAKLSIYKEQALQIIRKIETSNCNF